MYLMQIYVKLKPIQAFKQQKLKMLKIQDVKGQNGINEPVFALLGAHQIDVPFFHRILSVQKKLKILKEIE